VLDELHPAVHALAAVLQQRGWMLACAESCTGGLLAATLTDVAGSSGWFERGFVTYSNAAKVQHLHVPPDILAQHGAVSEATAAHMAQGVLSVCTTAQLALSTTGIAGPQGGTPDKSVGTVCFGWAWRGADAAMHTVTRMRVFPGNRQDIRHASVAYALQQALRLMDATD